MSEQQDKIFVRTFIGVIVVLVVITVALIFLASSAEMGFLDEERAALERDRVVARLQPVAAVRLSGEPMPETVAPKAQEAAGPMSGEEVVASVCAACHDTGLLNAPKTGTKADWEPRLAQGFDTLVKNAINGIRAMPPRGGNPNLSDEEIREAVTIMVEKSGLSAK